MFKKENDKKRQLDHGVLDYFSISFIVSDFVLRYSNFTRRTQNVSN